MPDNRPTKRRFSLPPLADYEVDFRNTFGRELTALERRFYELTRTVYGPQPQDEDGGDESTEKAS